MLVIDTFNKLKKKVLILNVQAFKDFLSWGDKEVAGTAFLHYSCVMSHKDIVSLLFPLLPRWYTGHP
jgi:hypothetical protein